MDLQFPLEGLDETRAFSRQRSMTTVGAQNVRSFEPGTDRARGGSRHGLVKYFPAQAVGVFPIQEITHLVTNDVSTPQATVGQLLYAKAVGAGFGLADGLSGTSLWTAGVSAGFQFACSCWDQVGNPYVAEVNTTTGATLVYSLGPVTGALTWTQSTIKVATGASRNVCGMAVIGSSLYLAVTGNSGVITGATNATPIVITCNNHLLSTGMTVTVAGVLGNTNANGTRTITVLSPNTFSLTASTGNAAYTSGGTWTSAQSVVYKIDTATGQTVSNFLNPANLPNLAFSTAAVDVLGVLGSVLGIDSIGVAANTNAFLTYDTAQIGTTNVATYFYGVAATNRRSKVISDGTAYFYVITSGLTSIIRKFNAAAAPIWFSTVMDSAVPQDLAFDPVAAKLVAVSGSAPSAAVLSLTDGSLVTAANPGGITSWNAIDADGQGNFTLWRDSVASNDVMGVNSSFSTIWGPSTVANAKHTGASVNRGQVASPLSGSRQIRGLLVSNGEIRRFDTTAATGLTGGVGALNPASVAPTIYSAQCGLNMFFVDGTVYKYYDSPSNSVKSWVASPGKLPVDPLSRGARLIATWRGRIVLAGIRGDPLNWFMSAQLQPFNFDYSPPITTTTQAVAGNNSPAGLIGDIVNCIIPYTDDVLIFGCSHSIWKMLGDPADGGQIVVVTHGLGMVWGRPFAIDPMGQIYFMGTDRAIYKMVPGALPVRISQSITRRLQSINVDPSVNQIRMVWDVVNQGLAVWVTPIPSINGTVAATTHFFWEERTNSWWPHVFANTNHDPLSVHLFEGDDPGDAKVLLGGRDGFVRQWNEAATTDDGTSISSFVILGPLPNKDMDVLLMKDLIAIFGANSGSVTYSVYAGVTAEAALASTPLVTGTLTAANNQRQYIRVSGFQTYVKIVSSSAWAMERIFVTYAPMGRIRGRGSLP